MLRELRRQIKRFLLVIKKNLKNKGILLFPHRYRILHKEESNYELRDIFLFGGARAIKTTSNLSILKNHNDHEFSINIFKKNPLVRLDRAILPSIGGTPNAYFHFLMYYVFPYLAQSQVQMPVVIPYELNDFEKDFLKQNGINYLDGVNDYLVASPLIGFDSKKLPAITSQILSNNYVKGDYPKRLYLSREGYTRRLKNISKEWLSYHGLENIILDNYSIPEQISMVHDAELVVGPHGGAFTNLYFSRKTKVVEVMPIDRDVAIFKDICTQFDLPYICVYGSILSFDQQTFTVNLDELSKAINTIEKA